jgi:hypothetical protein
LRFPTADLCRIPKGNRCGGRDEGSKQTIVHGISCGRTTGVLGPNCTEQAMCQISAIQVSPWGDRSELGSQPGDEWTNIDTGFASRAPDWLFLIRQVWDRRRETEYRRQESVRLGLPTPAFCLLSPVSFQVRQGLSVPPSLAIHRSNRYTNKNHRFLEFRLAG